MNKPLITRTVHVNLLDFLDNIETELSARQCYNADMLSKEAYEMAKEEDFNLLNMKLLTAVEIKLLDWEEYQNIREYFYSKYVKEVEEC